MNTSAQRFNLTMDSSKPDGDEEVSMKLEIDIACSLNFMTNAFVQLMNNDEKVRTAILTASIFLIAGHEGTYKDLSDVDEIINSVINKK
jgi:hypothetical protein